MADYEIKEFDNIIFNNGKKQQIHDPLWEEYAQLEYEISNNNHNPKDQIKINRYNELKKHFDIIKSENALNKAKERIKQNLISSDKSQDNSIIYTALTHFEKTNE